MAIRPPSDKDLAELSEFEADSPLGKEDGVDSAGVAPSTPRSSIYDGDVTDDGEPLNEQWQTLQIPSPAFLVALYIKAFRDGKQQLYNWQKEELAKLGNSLSTASVHNPYKLALCAANGSGKDYLIVTPTVVWMSLVNIRCLTIITSSSGSQLTAQTENYIRALCETINEYHQQPIFRIRQRYIKCNLTGSEIRLFATDEAGKAEGYHPLEPDAKMVIIVNEAKSVSEEIFGALRRCTGYTHWLNVSTPGAPFGSFHRACTRPSLGFEFRRIDYTDCLVDGASHMSDKERLADLEELGANSALYRSKWLALFTNVDTDSLLSTEVIDQLVDNKIAIAYNDWPIRIGGDIAAGGDENALIATRGNRIIKEEAMREKDTTLTADWFERQFQSLGIAKEHEYIFMDDGGIGHAVIDMLKRRGWEIRRVRNEAKAVRAQHYGNRGAELWYQVKRICEELLFRLDEASPKLRTQLVSRHYKKSASGGRIFLESKKEAKADGRPSPDRADAFVLSLCGLTLEDFMKSERVSESVAPRTKRIESNEALEAHIDDIAFGDAEQYENLGSQSNKRVHNSLAIAAGLSRPSKESKYATN
jgi:phage terminase large subunit